MAKEHIQMLIQVYVAHSWCYLCGTSSNVFKKTQQATALSSTCECHLIRNLQPLALIPPENILRPFCNRRVRHARCKRKRDPFVYDFNFHSNTHPVSVFVCTQPHDSTRHTREQLYLWTLAKIVLSYSFVPAEREIIFLAIYVSACEEPSSSGVAAPLWHCVSCGALMNNVRIYVHILAYMLM